MQYQRPMDMKTLPRKMIRVGMSSPWLLAAAAGLLILIVTTFALHNYRLEKRLMLNAMLQKASTLMRVVQSGTKSSYLVDMRSGRRLGNSWSIHAQRVVDHLVEDEEIRYLAVISTRGQVVVHTDPEKIGTMVTPPPHPSESDGGKGGNLIVFTVNEQAGQGRVFEAVRGFIPYRPLLPRWPLLQEDLLKDFLFSGSAADSLRLPDNLLQPEDTEQYLVVVGLAMQEFDRTLGRLQWQILMLSLAMLLVGLGGWFSLTAVQHFRLSQQALGNIQAFTALLVNRIPVGIIATDQSGRIVAWNHAIKEISGLSIDKATGRTPARLLPKELATFFNREAASGDQVQEISLTLNGRDVELLCHCLDILDREGLYQGQVLLISDVSEVRSLERKMREQERLVGIGRMAAGVAHEIRNPLSSVKGLAVLLRDTFGRQSSEGQTAALIVSEVDRVNRTITDILSLTRPGTLEPEPCELEPLLIRSLQLVGPEAAARKVETKLSVHGEIPRVNLDKDRFTQVLLNVLLNGIQAMGAGGTLTVTAMVEGNKVMVRILDTGCGMDGETMAQIFYPYFTTKSQGTGLGLALSQKIMLDHGGGIRVESEPGQGTVFILELPVAS